MADGERPLDYLDFELFFTADGPDRVQIQARSSRGEATASFCPPTSFGTGARFGAELFDAALTATVRRLFDESLAVAESAGLGMRLRLFFNRREASIAKASELPWELLNDPESGRFFALDPATPILRHLTVLQPNYLRLPTGPIKILAASSSPAGLPPLSFDTEWEAIDRWARSRVGIAVERLDNATRASLRRALVDPIDVFHFMGHGGFDESSGEGSLLLADERWRSNPDRHVVAAGGAGKSGAPQDAHAFGVGHPAAIDGLRGEVLAHLLKGSGGPRLAVLNACSTAKAAAAPTPRPFGGVAAALVLGGVPAVVAMQRPISDRAAAVFSAELYERLAAGGCLESAVAEARRAIYALQPDGQEWAIPALFLRLKDGQLFGGQKGLEAEEPPSPPQASAGIRNEVRVDAVHTGAAEIFGATYEGGSAAGPESNLIVAKLGTVDGSIHIGGTIRRKGGPGEGA